MSRNQFFILLILAIYGILAAITFFSMLLPMLYGQESGGQAPPAVTPTPVPTPTPTSPNPNLQYLPQKAYVQAYAPENGIPANSQPLQVVPQVVPAPVQSSVGSGDMTGILGILGMIAGTAGTIYAKFKGDRNKDDIRATNTSLLETKVAQTDLAKFSFDANKEKAEALNGTMPNIKIQKLEENAANFAEQAAKT